jgi:uroporphyrin-III C-methyltransferase/precorrin-2 dehydrogenase/sirohydrochlorin ferrochelatase
VLYDNLISPQILALVPRSAQRIYVGKRCAEHTLRQDAINALLVEHALRGKRVLRLKGGDPFIFGRGGEEIATLSAHGISCVFVTGRSQDASMDLDWPALARARQTIVVYMGLPGLQELCTKLVEHGLPARTRAAVVQQGTLSTQRVVTGTLASLPRLVARAKLHAPTLIIVGDVVRLREKLNWFEPEQPPARKPRA